MEIWASPSLPYTSSIQLDISITDFVDLVSSAAVRVLEAVDPTFHSESYTPPSQYRKDSAQDRVRKETLHGKGIFADISFSVTYLDLELCKKFCILVNSLDTKNGAEAYLVGEQGHTRILVYTAIVSAHNHRIKSIEDSIEKSGPEFGCATSWFKEDDLDLIAGWPAKFNFVPAVKPEVLPIKRPDYQARVKAWKEEQLKKAIK